MATQLLGVRLRRQTGMSSADVLDVRGGRRIESVRLRSDLAGAIGRSLVSRLTRADDMSTGVAEASTAIALAILMPLAGRVRRQEGQPRKRQWQTTMSVTVEAQVVNLQPEVDLDEIDELTAALRDCDEEGLASYSRARNGLDQNSRVCGR